MPDNPLSVEGLFVIAAIGFGFSLLIGSADALDDKGCRYDRLIKLSPGYVIGCEIFKKREWFLDSNAP